MERGDAALTASWSWIWPAALAVALRPALWSTAVRQVFVLARRGWWRRWPPLPMPGEAYLRFRLQTAYGDPERAPAPADVVTYLRWCREQRRPTR